MIRNHKIVIDNGKTYDTSNDIVRDVIRGDKCLLKKKIQLKDSRNFNYVVNPDGSVYIISPAGKALKAGAFHRTGEGLIFCTNRNPSVHYFYKYEGYGINAILFDLFSPDFIYISLVGKDEKNYRISRAEVEEYSVYYDADSIYEIQRIIPEKYLTEVNCNG